MFSKDSSRSSFLVIITLILTAAFSFSLPFSSCYFPHCLFFFNIPQFQYILFICKSAGQLSASLSSCCRIPQSHIPVVVS